MTLIKRPRAVGTEDFELGNKALIFYYVHTLSISALQKSNKSISCMLTKDLWLSCGQKYTATQKSKSDEMINIFGNIRKGTYLMHKINIIFVKK